MVIGITQSIRPKNGNEFELNCLVYFVPVPNLMDLQFFVNGASKPATDGRFKNGTMLYIRYLLWVNIGLGIEKLSVIEVFEGDAYHNKMEIYFDCPIIPNWRRGRDSILPFFFVLVK